MAGVLTPEEAVRSAVRKAAGIGVVGALHPGFDEAAMATLWTYMVTTIAGRSRVQLAAATVTKLVAAAVSACAAYSTGSKLLTWGMGLVVPGGLLVAAPAAITLNSALNAVFTYRLGRHCVRCFGRPGLDARDVLVIVRALVVVPSLGEIAEVRRMLAR
jgi:hypothetical protein